MVTYRRNASLLLAPKVVQARLSSFPDSVKPPLHTNCVPQGHINIGYREVYVFGVIDPYKNYTMC